MGVYEDLLRRKKIVEDAQGNITVNSVIDKNIRNKLTDNNIQTYKETQESNNQAISQMKNTIKRSARSTIWEQMQSLMGNKPITSSKFVNNFKDNLISNISKKDDNKNKNLIDDAKGLFKLTGLGASTGAKQTLNYIENANENNFSNYKDLKNTQFLTSKNVSEEDKVKAKTQNNLLLQMNGINTDKTIETNLTKKAINESIEKDNQKIQEEQSKMSNVVTEKLGEIAPSIGQQIPGIVASSVNPILGASYFITSAGGNYIDDAKQRGMTDEQAFKYGTIMGAIEGSLEAVGSKLTTNVGKNLLKKNIKGALVNYGLDIGENFLEEAIVEPISELVVQTTAGKEKANWSNILKRMWDSGVNGALVSAITGGASGLTGGVASNFQNNEYTNNTSNSQQQSTQAKQILPIQEISQEQNNIAQNRNTEQIKVDSENFSKQVDEVKNGTFPQRDMLTVLQNTPQVLKDIGLNDLPITMTQKHLDTIMNESGKHKDANYHNLGEDVVKQLPEAISNPLDIVKSNTKDDSIVLTTYLADKNNNTVIASIKIDGKGKVNDIRIDSNVMTSAYGKSNYDSFMKKNLEQGNLLYDIDRGVIKKVTGARFQLPRSSNSSTVTRLQLPRNDASITNSILPTQQNVNSTINNYSMQNDKKYSLPAQEVSEEVSTNLPQNIKAKKNNIDSDNLIQESNKMSDEETAEILTEIKGRTNEKRKLSAFLKANLIDKGIVFEELSRKTGNRDLQAKYDYTLTAEARGQNAIGNARYDYQTTIENGKIKKGDKNARQISKSLTDIIDEVGENPTSFYNYMYHQLNIDRMTLEERFGGDTGINYQRKNAIKNKPVFGKGVTAEISRRYVQELEKKHPEFKEYAQDVYDFLDANTKELVDNGVISKETQQLFKEMYPHYVPISRVTNKGQAINVPLDTRRTGVNSPIKRAKGGNRDINPLFQTMADRTLQTYRASARNNFGIELKNTLERAKQLNQITELTDIDSIMESMTDEEQNNNLLQEGINGENPTFTVFENGEKATYEISKDMYDALKPKNELLKRFDNSALSKGLNKMNNFRRGLLTEYNPVFSITNAIKDAQDVLLNSQHSARTYTKIPEATAQIVSKGYWYKEYIQNGGEQNSYFRDGEFEATKKSLPTKAKEVVKLPLKAISNVNNVIEMTPRLAEYIVSRQQGKSIETAMLDASRITTNFKAGGDITKTLNRNGFTFLNASVQGMQQQIRNIQEANAKGLKGYAVLATKYAIAGLPVLILNNLIWNDDEEYKELQDYVKDNYYIIGKTENGTFIRIPKGRAVATIQKIVSNADEFIKKAKTTSILDIDELGSQFWDDLKENISFAKDNLAPNNPLDNNVIAPITQVISNKTWYGDALVPTRLQDKPKEEQYDETTDEISKWIGKQLKVSPIKVNYLLDQYSGGAGDILLPKLTPQAENTVLEDKFSTDPVMKNKYPGEFFEKIDELTINKNSEKATDEDKVKYQYMSSVQDEMNDLYKEKREIQNSKATDKEKKEQLKEVQKKINNLAMNGLEKVEKMTKGKNYAQIDTKQYYKDIEEKWKSVSEKDIEKNNKSGLSLKTYSSYKYEMSKVKQEKVNKGEMAKEQSLKDNEQIQILLDSSYTDKEKSIIYEDYIKSSVKEGEYDSFKVIKASGININEYLKYEQQEFKSDKKDDGTLDGKTVSKSKQKKVEAYLNSMNIGGSQRLLLYAMQGYSITSSQKSQLVNYVQGLNIDKETKLELYNRFSGFKVYKNGTVNW